MERAPGTALNLYYHAVDARALPGDAPRPGTVTEGSLGDRLEGLLSSGRKAAPVASHAGSRPPGAGEFTVSFDDAHPSVLEIAVPLLAELRIPATVFVPTRYPGETDLVLGWREISALARLPGWTIGSHGGVHARASWRLYAETEAEHSARLERDAMESRAAIERHVGHPPDLYAYPFGEAPAAAREAVRRAGYRAAFTVGDAAGWDGDLLAIPRADGSEAGPREASAVGISVVVPACDRTDSLREVVRRLANQSYPIDRHEVLVVDDGSSRDLACVLADVSTPAVRILRLEGSDGTFRAGQARQLGADSARFGVVAFLDADVAVDRDYLWHLAWCHDRSPRTVVLGYISGYNLHDRGWVHETADIAGEERLTGDRVPVIPDRSREPVLASCLDNVDALAEPWRLAYTGNLSVDRGLLAEVGGFSPEFSGWGFEDVDLGIRLHRAGARFRFSRWALGYHLSEGGAGTGSRTSNPFRDPHPGREGFEGVLRNLALLARRHGDDGSVVAFCDRVRADIDEICDPPGSVGVEMGADLPFVWPFERLHARHPGGVDLHEILDRLAYARKLGARHLYLLGGDVGSSPHLGAVLDAARDGGFRSVTIETTAVPFAREDAARDMAGRGLDTVVVDVLCGRGHPLVLPGDPAAAGVYALGQSGVRVDARIVLGEDSQEAFGRALERCRMLGLPVRGVTVVGRAAPSWLSGRLPAGAGVEVVSPPVPGRAGS